MSQLASSSLSGTLLVIFLSQILSNAQVNVWLWLQHCFFSNEEVELLALLLRSVPL